MHYNTLHYWSKFQTNLTTFQWITSKKPLRSSQKLYFTQELQIRHKWNLAQIFITWTPLIYQNMRVSITGREGGTLKKPPENAIKLRESWLSHYLKPTQIVLKRRGFFTAIHNHLNLVLTQLEEGGGLEPPYGGDPPLYSKLYLLASCWIYIFSAYYIICISIFFVKFCSTLKLILDPPLKSVTYKRNVY